MYFPDRDDFARKNARDLLVVLTLSDEALHAA